jgi:hypothetical protein
LDIRLKGVHLMGGRQLVQLVLHLAPGFLKFSSPNERKASPSRTLWSP